MILLTRLFSAHGQLCASRPWEVIIAAVTVTVAMMSMSLFAAVNNKMCSFNYKSEPSTDDGTKSCDVVMLTVARCVVIVYFYMQFRNLRRLGSKYLIGIAGLFTVFSSFVFSICVINIFGTNLPSLNEALPFCLLLVDLSKACTLAKFALNSKTQDEVVDNIGRGMALLGPVITLDAVVETLVIAVGTMSGVKVLRTICCFGCLSVISNYFAFMTFYPACLALVLELWRGARPLQQLAHAWSPSDEEHKMNPVAQRIKMMMSAGLLVVHVHRRWCDGASGGGAGDSLAEMNASGILRPELVHSSTAVLPDLPLWQFYLRQSTYLSVDYVVTLTFATLIVVKYIVFDGGADSDCEPAPRGDLICARSLRDQQSVAVSEDMESMAVSDGPQSVAVSDGPQSVAVSEDMESMAVSDGPQSVAVSDGPQSVAVSDGPQSVAVSEDMESMAVSEGLECSAVLGGKKVECFLVSVETQTDRQRIFTVGDDSSDDDEDGWKASTVAQMVSMETQVTEEDLLGGAENQLPPGAVPTRPLHECMAILKSQDGASRLSDDEVLALVSDRQVAAYQLETVLQDHMRGVVLRRRHICQSLPTPTSIDKLPYANYDYKYVHGSCCENVVGYVPVPVGVVGPLQLDGKSFTVPMATTEGCLLASTNRGCRALSLCGGAWSVVTKDGMTRAPVVRFSCAQRANQVKLWLDVEQNYRMVTEAFNSTSRFARVSSIKVKQVARSLHLRFTAFTGDAMGMNMVSKGCEKALKLIKEFFPDMEVLSLSGNFCSDKKSSAVNWVEGRGKSVVCDAVVSGRVVREVLKTTAAALVDLNTEKNLIGSALAASLGGFNAHAANVVTAIYIATGQDPAQNVCSSNCLTILESCGPTREDLYISCTMPCIEVGTIGGGTVLPPQTACLEMLGVRGSDVVEPGTNAQTLARVVCATVLAAELSLMSALATGDLVKSHLRHNRSVLNMAQTSVTSPLFTASDCGKSHDAPPVFPADSRKSHTMPPGFPIDLTREIPGTCLKS